MKGVKAVAKYSNTVEYRISTSLDSSGIAKLQAEIRNVENELQLMANRDLISDTQATDAIRKVQQVRDAINKSFNTRLGMLDFSQLTRNLNNLEGGITGVRQAFSLAGTAGDKAFVSTIGQLGKLDTGLKSVSKTADKVFNTIGNTVRWGVVASGFQQVLNSVHSTVQYVRDLDTSLTNIMMVTGNSRDMMNEFAQSANDAAKALSSTTVSMTDAALVFAQQGFDINTSEQLARRSTQLANISQQETSVTSDQITTIMNAYDFTGDLEQIDAAMDSWAEVANVSAADVEELATAAQKAASTAKTTGVTLDQLNAQIATIESVTREAPENIGNALKTIYSRFADISLGNTLEDGVDLGKIAETLGQVGVEVLDDEGRMNNVGDIMEQLMEVWQTLDQTQQNAISTVIAGRYQLSRFQALMNRSDLYEDYLYASQNAEGTADEMQAIYGESLEGRLSKLQSTAEGIFNDLFNSSDFYGLVDALTQILDLTNQWVNAIGGVGPLLTGIGAVGTRVFKDSIGRNISGLIQNKEIQKQLNTNLAYSDLYALGLDPKNIDKDQDLVELAQFGRQNQTRMSEDQMQTHNTLLERSVNLRKEEYSTVERLEQAMIRINTLVKQSDSDITENLFKGIYDEQGNFIGVDQSAYNEYVKNTGNAIFNDTKAGQEASDHIFNVIGGITPEIGKMRQSISGFDKSEAKLKELSQAFENFEQAVKTAMNQVAFGENDINEINEALQYLQNELNEGVQDANKFAEAIAKIQTITSKTQDASGSSNINPSQILQEQGLLDKNRGEQEANAGAVAGFQANVQRGIDIANIANVAGAVGQLIFTWQSFQSLGSLWANSDIELGDKILQTIMNLATTVPMALSAFSDFKNILSDIETQAKKATVATETLEVAQAGASVTATKATATSKTTSVAVAGIGTASTKAATGVGVLSKALNTLSGPVGMGVGIGIMAILSGIGAAISAFNEIAEQEYQEAKTRAEDALNLYSEIQISTDNFDTLYQEYKNTENVSEEFISTAEELSEALGIQGANALIASDNFETLANKIDEAVQKQKELTKTDLEAFLAGSNKKSLEGNPFGIGNANIFTDLETANENNFFGVTTNGVRDEILDQEIKEAKANNDIDAAIGAVRRAILRWNEEIEKVEDEIKQKNLEHADEKTIQSLEDKKTQYLGYIDDLNNALGLEDISDYINTNTSLAELNLQDLDFTGKNYQQIIDTVMDPENGLVGFLESIGSFEDQLQWLIDNLPDKTAKLKLEARQSMLGLPDEIRDQIEDSRLSDEDIVYLRAEIDDKTLINNIDEIIDRINNGEELEDILVDIKPKEDFSGTNVRTDSDISSVIEDLDLTQEEYDGYVESMRAGDGELGSSGKGIQEINSALRENRDLLEEAEKAQQDVLDAYGEDSEEYEEASEKVLDLNEAIEENEQLLEDIESRAVESAKGVQELSESFEENAEIIRNTASDSLEYTDAVNALVPGLEHLLNIDMSGWGQALTNQFVAQNLNDIEAAINGNIEALQRLRSAAALQIMIKAGLDPNTEPDLYNQMLWLVNWANLNLPDIQAGASIDDSIFLEQLKAMIKAAYDSGYDINTILSALNGMGLDAEIDLESQPITYNVDVPRIMTNAMSSTSGSALSRVGAGVAAVLDTVSQSISGSIQIPVVKMVKKNNVGNPSRYSGSSGRGGSGGGGGGGGGGGSSYTPQTKDPIEDTVDRYEEVNTKLEDIGNEFERINSNRERLVGFDMVDGMNEEIKLLQRQIELHYQKLEIQKQEAEELRNELSSQYGIVFDDEGFMTNYATVHQSLIDEVNRLIDQYNATTSESGQESLEEQIESAEDRLNDFNDTYQRYDELWAGDLQETLNTLEDIEDQIEDIRIEAVNTSVEAADNLKDLEETANEFFNTLDHFGEDTGLRDAELAVSNLALGFDMGTEAANEFYDTIIKRGKERLKESGLTEDQRAAIEADIEKYQEAWDQLGAGTMEERGTGFFDYAMSNMNMILEQIRQFEETGYSTLFGENSEELYSTANDVFEQATGYLDDFESYYEDLQDAILDMIDEMSEKMEYRREQYERINDELEHQYDIIEMIHGDEAYTELNSVLEAQQLNYQSSIKNIQDQLSIWEDLILTMEEGSEQWKEINDQIIDAQEELNDLVEESLDNLTQQYENAINNITNAWVEGALGTDIDWASEQWELINRNADYYLDDVNAAYEIQKLQGKYLDLLDQSSDLHIQEQITNQMREQLEYLREKDKLSEYDVAYANAQLEILQRRIALEDAQRNKSQMRLRRDSQGNYSYVYTADESSVADAEEGLLDAQNNAYNLSKDQMIQAQGDSLSALQQAQQTLNDIWTNANLTLDEKTERTQFIIDNLKEYLAGTAEQLSESEKNIINDFIGMAEMLTDENGERLDETYEQIVNGNLDAFDQIDTRWSTSITSWLYNMDEFSTATDNMFANLVGQTADYQNQVSDLGQLIQQDFNNMSDSIQNCIDKTTQLNATQGEFINQLRNDSGVVKDYQSTLSDYGGMITDLENGMRDYANQVKDLQNQLEKEQMEDAAASSPIIIDTSKNPTGPPKGGSGAEQGGGGGALSDGIQVGDWVGYNGSYFYDSWGRTPAGNLFAGQPGAVQVDSYSFPRNGGDFNIHINNPNAGYMDLGWVKPDQLFDTGGYTGEWNDGIAALREGKLAFLHQKELVLNENDTNNILKAVNLVRQITQTLKDSAMNQFLTSLGNSKYNIKAQEESIKQEVHITAEFPNANSAAEIEEALLSLNNRAVQYSFKK